MPISKTPAGPAIAQRWPAAVIALSVFCWSPPVFADRDSVVIAVRLEPSSLDPRNGGAASIGQIGLYNVFETLTRVDNNGNVLPLLAKGWTVSNGGLRYRFDLVEGARFHDGSPFTVRSVIQNFERNKAKENQNRLWSVFANIDEIVADGDSAVAFTLKRPDGLFPFHVSRASAAILAPPRDESSGALPAGTGPYQYAGWVKGDHIALTRFEAYRDAATAAIPNVTFRFIGDAAEQATGLLDGEVDYLPNLLAPELFDQFADNPDFTALEGTTEGETILAMNHGHPALGDIRVRRAITHAIDRQAVIGRAMHGHGVSIGSHFAPHHPAYLDLTETLAFDPARARALLAEAGHGDGLTLTLKLPPRRYARRSAEVIAGMLGDVGIVVKIEPLEVAQWIHEVFREKRYDLTIAAHVEPMDIQIYAEPEYYFQYDSADFRDIVSRFDLATDVAGQHRLLELAQRKLADDAVNVFLFAMPKLGVAHRRLKGMWPNWPNFVNDATALRWE